MSLRYVLALFLFTFACSNSEFHGKASSERNATSEKDAGDASADGESGKPREFKSKSIGENNESDTAKRRASVGFGLSQQSVEASTPKDIEMIFLVDNSASMTNKMDRLKNSLGTMIARISGQIQNKVNFSFVKLSDYRKTLAGECCSFNDGTRNSFVPTNLLFRAINQSWLYERGSSAMNFSDPRTNAYQHLFLSDVTNANVSQTQAAVANYLRVDSTLSSEPLIAAGMEFINFRAFSDSSLAHRFDSGSMIHILSLSDEDNDTNIFGRGALSAAYQTDHYYATAPFYRQDDCAAKGLYEPGEEGKIYIPQSQLFCVAPGVLADSEIQKLNIDRPSTFKCSSDYMQTSEWTDPKKYIVSTYDKSGSSYCKISATWDCRKMVDGVEVIDRNLDYYATSKRLYTSCTANGPLKTQAFGNSEVANWSLSYLSLPPASCAPIACQLVAEPVKYTAIKDAAGKVTSVAEGDCATGFNKVDLGAAYKGGAYLYYTDSSKARRFCSKELPGATRSAAPASLTYALDPVLISTPVVQTYYLSLKDAATKAEVFSAFQASLRRYSNTSFVYDADRAAIISEPVLARQKFNNDPQGFLDFMRIVHPDKRVSWHSIADLDGLACPGEAASSGDIKKGDAYLALSKATTGFVGNICDASFDGITKDLGDKVVSSALTVSYDLSVTSPDEFQSELSGATVVRVVNETKHTDLPAGSYSYANGKLFLSPSAGNVNDRLRVYFEY